MGTADSSSFNNILSACRDQQVTGILRVRDAEIDAEAEIHFLSGIRDSVRLGPVEGDEAMARISQMANPEFSAMASLPPMSESSQQAFPKTGSLGNFRPVDLMRYCEVRCLTCALHLNCADRLVTVRYELGDLQSVEPEPDLTISVLEAVEGTYRFELPTFELPDMKAPRAVDANNLLEAPNADTASATASAETVEDFEDLEPLEDEDAAAQPAEKQLRFTSIAAPPPSASIALDETLLDATVPAKAPPPPSQRHSTSVSASPSLQQPPPRPSQRLPTPPLQAPEASEIFIADAPELVAPELEANSAVSVGERLLSERVMYPMAAVIACIALVILGYSFLSTPEPPLPATPSEVDSSGTPR